MLKQPDAVRALAAFKAPSYWPEPPLHENSRKFAKIHGNSRKQHSESSFRDLKNREGSFPIFPSPQKPTVYKNL